MVVLREVVMPTYTVFAPPPWKGEATSAADRFVFVRDGFYFWAFLLTPFWLLRYRLWLAFVLYLVASIALAAVMKIAATPPSVQFLAEFLVALLIGFEAASIRRRKLAWKGWSMLGFAVGDDLEMAERRFFTAWSERAGEAAPSPPLVVPPPAPPRAATPHDIIGLFPEAGPSR